MRYTAGANEPFRRWVRSLPCLVAVSLGHRKDCIGPVEFCHVRHRKMGGRSAPADVGNGWPGCTAHHGEMHRLWWPRFEARYDLPPIRLVAEYLGRQWQGLDFMAPAYPEDWPALRATLERPERTGGKGRT